MPQNFCFFFSTFMHCIANLGHSRIQLEGVINNQVMSLWGIIVAVIPFIAKIIAILIYRSDHSGHGSKRDMFRQYLNILTGTQRMPVIPLNAALARTLCSLQLNHQESLWQRKHLEPFLTM